MPFFSAIANICILIHDKTISIIWYFIFCDIWIDTHVTHFADIKHFANEMKAKFFAKKCTTQKNPDVQIILFYGNS